MRVVFWGTYDTGKPRVRILLRGLRENGVEVLECHTDVWGGIEDKSQVKGTWARLKLALRWLFSYPWLIMRYLRMPAHDAVVVGYLGQLDVLMLWPYAKLRGVPIIWDAFLSLYNTVVEDRKLVGPRHVLAKLLFAWESVACQAADRVVLDTAAHARYFEQTFDVPANKVHAVFVGAEPEAFPAIVDRDRATDEPFTVLFYGQFIPLHGIETIVQAARLLEAEDIQWQLIGTGQQAGQIRALLEAHPLPRLQWQSWVDYPELSAWLARADICLGIFGTTEKAARVIPNKVFQIIASGRPLVTADTPAVRELYEGQTGITLVPAGDAEALATAVMALRRTPIPAGEAPLYADLRARIHPQAIGQALKDIIEMADNTE